MDWLTEWGVYSIVDWVEVTKPNSSDRCSSTPRSLPFGDPLGPRSRRAPQAVVGNAHPTKKLEYGVLCGLNLSQFAGFLVLF